MDIIKYLSRFIPPEITKNGVSYTFRLFINHPHYDIRFCYNTDSREKYDDIPSFLYLAENISNNERLLEELKRLRKKLKEDGLLTGLYSAKQGYTRKKFLET